MNETMKITGRILSLAVMILSALTAGCRDRTPRLQPLPDHAVILAFGDSLTAGNGAPRINSYPAILQELTGWQIINAGVPGEISAEGVKRLPRLLQRHHPDLVILCHGGNDLLRRIAHRTTAAHLAAMIEMTRKSGAQIVMLGVPQPGLLPSSADFYQELADRYQIPIENEILSAILRNSSLKSDMIHPNAAGYKRMAEALATVLERSGA